MDTPMKSLKVLQILYGSKSETCKMSLAQERSSLPALESDIRVVAKTWFNQDEHTAVGPFIHSLAARIRPVRCSRSLHRRNELQDGDTVSPVPLERMLRLGPRDCARSFIHESTRERTPLGHAHRDHIRDLSIEQIQKMYRQTIRQLIDEVAETEKFFRVGIVAIDITEADPFTSDRATRTKEQTDEYAYPWATVQLVGNTVPLVLDARPVRKGESRCHLLTTYTTAA